MTFISIHFDIIYVVFFGACMRCTWLCSLKPGVTASELMDIATKFASGQEAVEAIFRKDK
jgi:hypothetical protein